MHYKITTILSGILHRWAYWTFFTHWDKITPIRQFDRMICTVQKCHVNKNSDQVLKIYKEIIYLNYLGLLAKTLKNLKSLLFD